MGDGAESGRLHLPLLTAALIGAVASVGSRYGVWRHELPLAVAYRLGFSGRTLLAGRGWNVATSQLLTRDGFMAASIMVSLAIMLGGYELLAGTRRAAVVAVAGGAAGPTVVTVMLGVGSALHWEFATRTLSTLDYGASAVTAAAGGALVAVVGQRRLRQLAVLFVLGGLVVHHQLADWEHLVAFPTGYGLARWLQPSSKRAQSIQVDWRRLRDRAQPLRWSARTLAAVAATAAGALSIGVMPGISAVPASAAASGSTAARVLDTSYPTPSLGGGHRRVLIVLPRGSAGGRRFPVLELLHGSLGRPDDALTGLDLLSSPMASTAILVIPDGRGPVVANGDFADTSRQRLGAAMSNDLRPWVDATFPTDGRWAIAGYSAGGYGAAYLADRYSNDYQLGCPMSGYFTARDPAFAGEAQTVRDAASPILHAAAHRLRLLLVAGTSDADAMHEINLYSAALAKAGQPYEVFEPPGAHSNSVWRAGTERCLQILTTLPFTTN